MKNLYLFLFLTFVVQWGHAQYKPLPMQNAEWINYGGIALLSCPTCTFVNYKYYTDGDTIINSMIYTKIRKLEGPNLNDVSLFPTYTGAIRQDTLHQKVYVVLTDSTTEHILYDFSLQVGDTNNSVLHSLVSNCLGFNTETLYLIDTIQVNGNDHRVFHFQGSCAGNGVSYIEGIGSDFGLLFANLMDIQESHLACLKINNQTYYPNETAYCQFSVEGIDELNRKPVFEISPNPASNVLDISLVENAANLEGKLRDNQGKVLKLLLLNSGQNNLDINELESGIYFIEVNGYCARFIKN
ncbi:MAG: T9SS type A sorting domain-containing protein [Sediminibacterium sp.]